ncbi:MAG: cytidine deaminase [Alphaproteobacteria bacterium]
MSFKPEYLQAAKQAMDKAYVPYSHFPVGVALIGQNNKTYLGCNVENAAYPIGNCAEPSAIAAMVLDGCTQIKAIIVMGKGSELVTPCGGCRQRIREFANDDTPIYICSPDALRLETNLAELLPYSFGPDNLKDVKKK